MIVSEEDFEEASRHKWHASNESDGKAWYATRFIGKTKIKFHRELMGLEKNDPRIILHLDGDGLDNRRENLEVMTRSEYAKTVKPAAPKRAKKTSIGRLRKRKPKKKIKKIKSQQMSFLGSIE